MTYLIGGWGCEFFVRKIPRTGKSISIALALRACVRAKLREWGDSSVARVGDANLWGYLRPFVLDFQSQPGELQIGLSCFSQRGKPVIVVVAVVRLNFAFCVVSALGTFVPLVPLGPQCRWSRWALGAYYRKFDDR